MKQKRLVLKLNNEIIGIYNTYSAVGKYFNTSLQQIKNIINKQDNKNFIIFNEKQYYIEYTEIDIDDISYTAEKIKKQKEYQKKYKQSIRKNNPILYKKQKTSNSL